ncbi:protein NDR1-like [Elaeis guineensis]|uniref:NDR1/HIN1-like protein 2 n=1 Tax=Elaeis guineensis var. tenera TaxID=51953 RepID=A0A6I9QIQ3_ELAGV|nr:NDR1/HIN1-like protein 2 [Elaeis guineensis]
MSSALPSPPPPSHHHVQRLRTLFKAHRVRESLTTRACKLLCSFFLSLLLAAGVILFVLWLSLRPHRPRFHVSSFSAPVLSPSAGTAFSFDVSDRNPNGNIGIFYDAVAGSVFYRDNRVGSEPKLAGPFYQPPKNTTVIHGAVDGASLSPEELAADLRSGRVGFRLELSTTIRFRVSTWDTHRHRLHVSCSVEVGPDGAILAASKSRRCSLYFF